MFGLTRAFLVGSIAFFAFFWNAEASENTSRKGGIVLESSGFSKQRQDYPNSKTCADIIRLADLNERLSGIKPSDPEYSGILKQLSSFVVNADEARDPGYSTYFGLDINADGVIDEVKRSCGNGSGMQCMLSVVMSGGSGFDTEEIDPFYLSQFNGKVYLISKNQNHNHAPKNTVTYQIHQVTPKGIHVVCP